MTVPPDDDWFPASGQSSGRSPGRSPGRDLGLEPDRSDEDRRSTMLVVLGSLGALVLAVGMALAVVFAFGDSGDEQTLVPEAAGAGSDPSPGSPTSSSGTPTSSPTTSPTPTASPTSSPKPTLPPVEVLAEFSSPTGNLDCHITNRWARCEIADYDYEPPPRDDCTVTWGDTVSVSADGAVFICHASSLGGGFSELGYGDEITEGDFTCGSSRDGMTCRHDPSGASFHLARDAAELS